MGFTKEEQQAIWSIIASILHLGNLEFDEKGLDNNNPCTLIQPEALSAASDLMQIKEENLKKSFLNKTRTIGKQVIDSKMNKADCVAMKDSFTKALYERMFNWLVRKLNKTITTKEYMNTKFDDIINDKTRYSIGLLDIFGFEVFKVNSFEQFCINFANEKLQQLYISYVFKAEINEFISEGLKDFLFELNFKDNQPIIDLLEQPPMGIFNMLDESSQLASSDESLLSNIVKNHKANPFFKTPKLSKETFLIIHTAKDVEYNINGFR
jgi:myosin heavy subunit